MHCLSTVASCSGGTDYWHIFWARIDGILFLHQNLDLWWNFLCGNNIKIINDKVTEIFLLEVLASFLEFLRLKFQTMFPTLASITIFLQCAPFVASFVTDFSLPLSLFKTIPSLSSFLSPRSWVSQSLDKLLGWQLWIYYTTYLSFLKHWCKLCPDFCCSEFSILFVSGFCYSHHWIFDLGFHPLFLILSACRSHGWRNSSSLFFFSNAFVSLVLLI